MSVESERLLELWNAERAALQNGNWRQAAATGYVMAGGDLNRAKEILQLLPVVRMQKKIEGKDLPGPDSIWATVLPYIYQFVSEAIGEDFDALTQGKELDFLKTS